MSIFLLDAASSWDMNFQTPATMIMEKIVDLHHDVMFFLIAVVCFVSWILVRTIYFYREENRDTPRVSFTHHTRLEQIWTFVPTAILLLIAAPSFSLLYSIDALAEPKVTIKAIGHQWYWSYEITDMISERDINFDSYMLLESDLPRGALRLLEVDNRLLLPVRTDIRIIITSADVIHSWALPALGVKMDACPGRLNQVSLHMNRPGVFYGQCSELCGINHSFMPIVVEGVTIDQYRVWIAPDFQPIEASNGKIVETSTADRLLVVSSPTVQVYDPRVVDKWYKYSLAVCALAVAICGSLSTPWTASTIWAGLKTTQTIWLVTGAKQTYTFEVLSALTQWFGSVSVWRFIDAIAFENGWNPLTDFMTSVIIGVVGTLSCRKYLDALLDWFDPLIIRDPEDPLGELLREIFSNYPHMEREFLNCVSKTREAADYAADLNGRLTPEDLASLANNILDQYRAGVYDVPVELIAEAVTWLDALCVAAL